MQAWPTFTDNGSLLKGRGCRHALQSKGHHCADKDEGVAYSYGCTDVGTDRGTEGVTDGGSELSPSPSIHENSHDPEAKSKASSFNGKNEENNKN